MPQTAENEIGVLKQKIEDAKVRLGVQKDARTRILKELRQFKITNLDQARKSLTTLKAEADKLDSEAASLLARARKLLERYE